MGVAMKNKWQPNKWPDERKDDIHKTVVEVREVARILLNDLEMWDYWIQRDYGRLHDLVGSLYDKLDIEALAQDNARRNKATRDKAKAAEERNKNNGPAKGRNKPTRT